MDKPEHKLTSGIAIHLVNTNWISMDFKGVFLPQTRFVHAEEHSAVWAHCFAILHHLLHQLLSCLSPLPDWGYIPKSALTHVKHLNKQVNVLRLELQLMPLHRQDGNTEDKQLTSAWAHYLDSRWGRKQCPITALHDMQNLSLTSLQQTLRNVCHKETTGLWYIFSVHTFP